MVYCKAKYLLKIGVLKSRICCLQGVIINMVVILKASQKRVFEKANTHEYVVTVTGYSLVKTRSHIYTTGQENYKLVHRVQFVTYILRHYKYRLMAK